MGSNALAFVMLSAAKHLSLINIAETLRQAQGDNTPYPPGCRIKSGMTVYKNCHAERSETSQPY